MFWVHYYSWSYVGDMGVGLENDLIGYADDHTLKAVIRSPQQRHEVAQSIDRDLERIKYGVVVGV